MTEEERDKRTQMHVRRVRRIRGFYSNLITYVWVNILLIIINLLTNRHHLWFYWVSLIWGFVLLMQAINIFTIRDRFLGEEWEEKKIRDLMEKDKKNKE